MRRVINSKSGLISTRQGTKKTQLGSMHRARYGGGNTKNPAPTDSCTARLPHLVTEARLLAISV